MRQAVRILLVDLERGQWDCLLAWCKSGSQHSDRVIARDEDHDEEDDEEDDEEEDDDDDDDDDGGDDGGEQQREGKEGDGVAEVLLILGRMITVYHGLSITTAVPSDVISLAVWCR